MLKYTKYILLFIFLNAEFIQYTLQMDFGDITITIAIQIHCKSVEHTLILH